tara:strand:- start:496 stop:1554 length:1059 start_codon:yes stop_codon:yes gene_type:complete
MLLLLHTTLALAPKPFKPSTRRWMATTQPTRRWLAGTRMADEPAQTTWPALLDAEERSHAELERQLFIAAEDFSGVVESLAESNRRIEELVSQKSSLSDKLSAECALLKQQTASLKCECDTFKGEAATLRNEVQVTSVRASALEMERDALEAQLRESAARADALAAQLREASARADATAIERDSFRTKADALASSLMNAIQRVRRQTDALDEFSSRSMLALLEYALRRDAPVAMQILRTNSREVVALCGSLVSGLALSLRGALRACVTVAWRAEVHYVRPALLGLRTNSHAAAALCSNLFAGLALWLRGVLSACVDVPARVGRWWGMVLSDLFEGAGQSPSPRARRSAPVAP